MKHFYKVLVTVLAVLMMLCTSLFVSAADSIDELTVSGEQRNAYRQVLQGIVDTYGVFNAAGQFENSVGFVDARFVDLAGDGEKEMVVIYAIPPVSFESYEESSLCTKIYTCTGNTASEIFTSSAGIYLTQDFVAYNDGNTPYFIYGNGYYSDTIYCWRDGEFITAGDDFTEDEQAYIAEAGHLLGGFAAEYEIKLSIWAKRLGITLQPFENRLADCYVTLSNSYSSDSAIELLSSLDIKLPQHIRLGNIPYLGTRQNCKMTDEMAKAYADVINTFPRGAFDKKREVLLIDHANDGMPLLLIADYNPDIQSGVWYHLFTWDGNAAVEFDLGGQIYTSYSFGYYKGEPVLIEYDYGGTGDSYYFGTTLYKIQNATIEPLASYERYRAYSYDGQNAYGDKPDLFSSGMAPVSELLNAGWLRDNDYFYIDYVNGEPKLFSSADERNAWLNEWNNSISELNHFGVFYNLIGFDNSNDASNALLTYADTYSRYSYPLITEKNEAEIVKGIAEAVAKAVGGEITDIYKLSDGVYYVLITVNGEEKGAVVIGGRKDGKIQWNVSETHDSPANETTLNSIVSGIISKPNITLDYGNISGSNTSDIVDYIRDSLDNMDGITPNDAGKGVLSSYIESAISSSCSKAVSGKNNRLTVPANEIEKLANQAIKTKQEIEALLSERDVMLNKSLTIIIRILWNDIDNNAPCQITLDKSVLESMSGCTLQILLGDAKHYVQISESNLLKLIELFGTVTIQLSKSESGVYIINFLDAAGAVIEKIEHPVTVGLPAQSATSTIMVSYGGGSDNWGGQFDSASGIISFDASYSGRYEVLENNVEITDIDELDDETKSAISFLASKEYMSAENGEFLPENALTRYHFSKALVGMFFALDRSLTLSFPDVPAESPYYSYVASAAASNIIVGYDDGMFHGDREITTEQMLALAARTLINYKGYTLPTNPNSYLNAFEDGDEVSDWAKQQVALAVREGLVDLGGTLDPLGNVTRGEAALILYRLFLLLHEVPAVALELPEIEDADEQTTAVQTDKATPEESDDEPDAKGNDDADEDDDEDESKDSSSASVIVTAAAIVAISLAAIIGVVVFAVKKKR